MLIRDILARPAGPALSAGLALLVFALVPPARADQESAAVQAVRTALLEPLASTDDPKELAKALEERKQKLLRVIDDNSKLQNLGDMAQALLLLNWSESSTGVADSSKIDRDAYKVLLTRFLKSLNGEIKAADKAPEIRSAVATLVGEFAATSRSGLSSKRGNQLLVDDMPRFTELAAGLAEKDRVPEVRAAAARALAKIQSDPKGDPPQPVTVPALEAMLKDADPAVRRAGATALGDLLRGTRSADRGGFAASPVVEPAFNNLPEFGPQVARAAGAVLNGKESDPEVRRLVASALVQVASTLKAKLRPTIISDELHKQMRPVIDALWAQTSALERASRDDDPRVRHTALRAFEEMGEARQFWVAPATETLKNLPPIDTKPRGGSVKPPRLTAVPEEPTELTLTYAVEQAPAAKPKDAPPPLADAIPALVTRLRDERVRNRLAALDAIGTITTRWEFDQSIQQLSRKRKTLAEELGAKPAADAARAVTRALADPDRFVRWAASRTLGEMAPLDDVENGEGVERGAVAGLTRLLSDADPDDRLRSANALGRFGAAARDAVPALARASLNRGDLEARISAAHAIEAVGGHAAEAVPALAENLGDPNVRLRRTAAEALASYGAEAAAAKPALNRALFDSDPEVRRIASEALLKIGTGR